MNGIGKAVILLGGLLGIEQASGQALSYEVRFRDEVVATQQVVLAQTDAGMRVTTSFAVDLHVFVAVHHYAEELSATFRPDGTVVEFSARISDGPRRVEVQGRPGVNDGVQVIRTDMEGSSTNLVAREDYDFNSLMMYGADPATFLPTNRPVRLLSIADGQVVPVELQTISESKTFERQYLKSLHLIWRNGQHVSHSWHPERFSSLPDRYIRQSDAGEFTFTLLR